MCERGKQWRDPLPHAQGMRNHPSTSALVLSTSITSSGRFGSRQQDRHWRTDFEWPKTNMSGTTVTDGVLVIDNTARPDTGKSKVNVTMAHW